MKKAALVLEKFTQFVDKYGIPFHGFSVVFWLWITYLNYKNIALKPVKILMVFSILFLILSTIAFIQAIKRRK